MAATSSLSGWFTFGYWSIWLAPHDPRCPACRSWLNWDSTSYSLSFPRSPPTERYNHQVSATEAVLNRGTNSQNGEIYYWNYLNYCIWYAMLVLKVVHVFLETRTPWPWLSSSINDVIICNMRVAILCALELEPGYNFMKDICFWLPNS